MNTERKMANYHIGEHQGEEVCVVAVIKNSKEVVIKLVILDNETLESKTVNADEVRSVGFGVGVPTFYV